MMSFDLQGFLRAIDGSKQIIDNLTVEFTQKELSHIAQEKTLEKQNQDLTQLLETTQNQDKKTIAELQAKLQPDPQEVFWNNRYPKIDKTYLRHETDGDYSIDVRDFFQENDATIPIVGGVNNDDKAFNALTWVRRNITYTSDDSPNTYKTSEYWAYSYQTLRHRAGDCEDGAIIMSNIMLKSGIPYWRIRLNAGSVNGGGHCYLTYCRETDNQFVVLDWCYWPTDSPIKDRKLHKDEQNYDDPNKNFYIWFSWNKLYCFGQMQTMVGMPDYLGVNK